MMYDSLRKKSLSALFSEMSRVKKLSATVAIALAALSFIAHASTGTFQATVQAVSEPEIVEQTALHFGRIQTGVGASCSLNSSGVASGDCDAADASISPATIQVSGLPENSEVNLRIVGSASSHLDLSTSSRVTFGSSTLDLADGIIQPISLSGSDTSFDITVFGDLTVTQELVYEQVYTTDYQVTVTFQ